MLRIFNKITGIKQTDNRLQRFKHGITFEIVITNIRGIIRNTIFYIEKYNNNNVHNLVAIIEYGKIIVHITWYKYFYLSHFKKLNLQRSKLFK